MPLDSGHHRASTRDTTLRLLLGDRSQASAAARTIADRRHAVGRRGQNAGWLDVVCLCSEWASLPALRRRIDELGISMDEVARDRLRPWVNEVFLRSASCLSVGANALAALAAAGVDAVPIKGVAAIAALYKGPQDRTLGDADVLVRPRDVNAAIATLGRIGLHPQLDTSTAAYLARARRWPNAGNQSIPLWHSTHVELDLHWQLGPIDTESVLAGAHPAVIYGKAIRVPNAAHSALLAAHHVLRNGFEMDRSLRDLADCQRWIEALAADADVLQLIEASAQWRLQAPMLGVLRILAHFQHAGRAATVLPALTAAMPVSERRRADALAECFFVQTTSGRWNVDLLRSLHAPVLVDFLRRTVARRASYTAQQGRHRAGRTRVAPPLWKRVWRIGYALPRIRWRLLWAIKGASDHAFSGSDTADR